MPLDPAGSNPIVQITFNSSDWMSCTLLFKNKIPGSKVVTIFTPNNENSNSHPFPIDPTQSPISVGSLSALIGCQIAWIVSVLDTDRTSGIKFSFNLDIQQSGLSIMSSPVIIKDKDPNVAIGPGGISALFNGSFRF